MSTDTPTLTDTILAFENGITNLSTDAAIGLLNDWADTIRASGRDDLEGIATMLQQIGDRLHERPVPAHEVGDLLKRAGAHTVEAASMATDEAEAGKLRTLGGLCTAAGKALAGTGRTREKAPYASYATDDAAADSLQSQNKADRLADTP